MNHDVGVVHSAVQLRSRSSPEERSRGNSYSLLLLLALSLDLVTPFLIWKGVLPEFTRWVSHAVVALMLVGVYTRMMAFDRVPGALWAIAGISAVGVSVALYQGQGFAATAWGWWLMFQFPLVGIFAYLQPRWPRSLWKYLKIACVSILSLELLIQIAQYLTGETPGDSLAGTFGEKGVGPLIVFVLFCLCIAMGEFLVSREWKPLLIVLVLGSVSSTLGEIKFFPFAVATLGFLTLFIAVFQTGRIGQLIKYFALFAMVIGLFFVGYDAIVVPARGSESLTSYLNLETLGEYLGGFEETEGEGIYGTKIHPGRNYALLHGWNEINDNLLSLVAGNGLGARAESQTLGIIGEGLLRDTSGVSTSTSLLVILQEYGLLGIILMGSVVLWITIRLLTDIRKNPYSRANALRYALLLFSILWPVWLYYHRVWTFRVPMLLYWSTLGYVLRNSVGNYEVAEQLEVGLVGNTFATGSAFERYR